MRCFRPVRRRVERLWAVQVVRLRLLPPGRECWRQSFSEAGNLSSTCLAEAGDPSCAKLAGCRNDAPLFPRCQRPYARGCGAQDGGRAAKPDGNGPTGRGDRYLPAHPDRNLPRQARGCARTMRAPLAAAGIVLLMLTWLSLRGMNIGAQRFDQALQGLDHFAMVERTLQRDILSARVGLLRNYDPLVQETNALRSALDQLREAMAGNKQQMGVVERLASSIGRQEDLTEQFKSANALLQNSLTYFGLISARLSASGPNDPSLAAINALSAAMLNLTLNTSTANALEVK